jgi:phosphoglucomutase
VDPTEEYNKMVMELFDIEEIKSFIKEKQPKVLVDSLHAISGVYTKGIFCDLLGLPLSCLRNTEPLEDFGGHHPDPNLTYAKDLVSLMYTGEYDFGVAFDGDADRNIILGKKFFVTPSDSLAVIAARRNAVKYFRDGGFKGVARSMPTSTAVDAVVSKSTTEKETLPFAETPTGWKFFGNLMDSGRLSLCGEESFGTGCDAIREKDGIWAALAWLSILAEANKGKDTLVSVEDILHVHWETYGRNYYSRYDYEEVDSGAANKLMDRIRGMQADAAAGKESPLKGLLLGGKVIESSDDFCYHDPCDGSVAEQQGIRFLLAGGTRVLVRLSGTGSSGATIRVYFDLYEENPTKLALEAKDVLGQLITDSLKFIQIEELTGRKEPTVIT